MGWWCSQAGTRGRGAGLAFRCALALGLAACSVFDAKLLDPRGPQMPPPGPAADAGHDARVPDPPVNDADASLPHDAAMTDGASGSDASEPHDAALFDAEATDASDVDAAIDAGDTCEPSNTADFCTAIPALPAAPIIDGALDCGPPLRALPEATWNGASALPAAHAAQIALAHRSDGLYVFIEVRGRAPAPHPSPDAIYCGDAIELYLDADGVLASEGAYDIPGTMQFIAAAPASAEAPNAHAERYAGGATQGAWTSSNFHIGWLADGYTLEAFIEAADLGLATWTPATSIGLDVVIDVAGEASDPNLRCGLQLGQYFLRVSSITPSSCNGEPWCDTRAFCTPALQ